MAKDIALDRPGSVQRRIRAQCARCGRCHPRDGAGRVSGTREHRHARALRARVEGAGRLEIVFQHLAALARPEFGAAGNPAHRRSAAPHPGARGDRPRAVAQGDEGDGRRLQARSGTPGRRSAWTMPEKTIDAVSGITARYVHKVLPDLMGLPDRGPREDDAVRQRRVGDHGADERFVQRGDGQRRRQLRMGGQGVQPREHPARQSGRRNVRGRRPRRDQRTGCEAV